MGFELILGVSSTRFDVRFHVFDYQSLIHGLRENGLQLGHLANKQERWIAQLFKKTILPSKAGDGRPTGTMHLWEV